LRAQLANIRRSRRIIFCACGTSYHSCVAVSFLVFVVCGLIEADSG
jgi:glucosamine--fructose-6-phosphate aminotransferase (isomerizing)